MACDLEGLPVYGPDGSPVGDPDLSRGYLRPGFRVRADAAPIDDVGKFAWEDGDWEPYAEYVPYSDAELEAMRAAEARERMASALPALILELRTRV